MRYIAAVLVAAFISLLTLPAFAATSGLVRGNVIVNGAPKAGVLVTVAGEGSTFKTTSDASGNFAFQQVPFGHYQVTAHADGVPDASQTLDLASDQVATINLQLGTIKEIGSTRVTATGGASGAPVSQNSITRQTISALPTSNNLNAIVQTVPGIVKFSYDEPVAHGFHGLTYEIDGAPLPQATSSNFAQIIDPKSIDSMEIFTGAFPAEYGGSRQGAVINIVSNRASDVVQPRSYLTFGTGNYGQALAGLNSQFKFGSTTVFLNANTQRNNRGLDAPTFTPIHDNSSQADEFLRLITPAGNRATLAFDYSNQFAQFQIPINTDPNNVNDPVVSVPGTDDVQREYDRFANLNYTLTSKGGNGILQIIPWYRYTRIAYDGDLASDVLATQPDPVTGIPTNLAGLRQNRVATYAGLRASNFIASEHHAIKFGIDASRENFTSHMQFAQFGMPDTFDNVTQAGTLIGMYVQDKWSPSRALTVNYGLRYDHSTGFTGGNQLSPRIGINIAPDSKNVIHFYYGRLYAAPALEDVRNSCVLLSGCSDTPVYDLKPERDSYYEMGVAHTFSSQMTGYINYFSRTAANVLDTTQFLNTPLFAVFNNASGRDSGFELRLQDRMPGGDSWFISAANSQAEAAGVSGSTFLFPPDQLAGGFQPEDHDQLWEANGAYTHRFGSNKAWFASLQGEYGTGYPVQFQAGPARLPAHLTDGYFTGPGRRKGSGPLVRLFARCPEPLEPSVHHQDGERVQHDPDLLRTQRALTGNCAVVILSAFGLILAVTTGGVQTLNSSSQPMAATLDARAQQSPLDQELTIHEYGGGSAAPIRFYDRDMTKKLHLIIVDDGLQHFMHVHPVLQADGAFILKQHFPHGGIWHLYADGIPHNFGRAVFRFDLTLPGRFTPPSPPQRTATAMARAGPYVVRIGTTSLRAGAITMLTMHIDERGRPARDLRPYLGARAHAVMIGDDFSYIHAHAMSAHMQMPRMNMPVMAATPNVLASEDPCNQDAEVGMSLVELPPTARVAADMSVMLLPPKPGRYHLWVQFRGAAGVFTAPFIIQVR